VSGLCILASDVMHNPPVFYLLTTIHLYNQFFWFLVFVHSFFLIIIFKSFKSGIDEGDRMVDD